MRSPAKPGSWSECSLRFFKTPVFVRLESRTCRGPRVGKTRIGIDVRSKTRVGRLRSFTPGARKKRGDEKRQKNQGPEGKLSPVHDLV